MTYDNKLIQEGINFLRAMRGGSTIAELADDLGTVSEEHIKKAIKAAREHKDASEKPPRVVFVTPQVKVYSDLASGERQVVTEVQVELLRDLIAHFGREPHHEFTTMLPVKITIKRV